MPVTIPARFQFDCELEKLTFVHPVPRSLVTPTGAATNPSFVADFVATLGPIIQQRDAACRAASRKMCQNCGATSTKVLQTPMSWLHNVGDPFVNVWVNPVCNKGECEVEVRREIQDTMALVGKPPDGEKAWESAGKQQSGIQEAMPCPVCGKADDTLKCSRCGLVAYCGKEHQKQDWKLHKKVCTAR